MRLSWVVMFLALLVTTALLANDRDRAARQQELDAACESARAKRLAADRERLAVECARNEGRSQNDCEAEFSNYGERTGNRPPLYYDLPECAVALEFQKSARRSR